MENNKMRDDYYFSVYDIVLNEEGKIRVDFYNAYLQVVGKDRNYIFDYKTSIYPDDLCSCLTNLKLKSYVSMNAVKPSFWSAFSINPLINMKLLLLAKNHKILERSYDEHIIIDGMCYIAEYIYYINVNTGQEYAMSIGTEKYSLEKIEELKQQGFKAIEESFLLKESVLGKKEKIR